MKLFLRLILIGVATYFLSIVFPWWIVVIIGLLVGLLIPGGALNTFISGFLGVGIVWMSYAWKLDVENDSRFSELMLDILPLGDTMILISVVGMIGGLCGGFSTMTGSLLRGSRKKKRDTGYYQ